MTGSLGWIFLAFVLYLALMIVVGAIYAKKNSSSEDYFLGGRNLNGFVAALSAQASDMSGWLLMGLPGSVYAFGTGQVWIAVGLFIGTVCNWLFISKRLRRYTIRANNALTLPTYFENRFHDKRRVLLLVSSIKSTTVFLFFSSFVDVIIPLGLFKIYCINNLDFKFGSCILFVFRDIIPFLIASFINILTPSS